MPARFHDPVLVVAYEETDICENPYPYRSPKGRIETELGEVHSPESCRERDIMPYPQNKPADKGTDIPVSQKERLPFQEMFLGNAEIFAVPEYERSSKIHRDIIIKECAEHASHRPGYDYPCPAHLLLVDQISCGRNHKLRRQRDEGALDKHEEHNSRISHGADGIYEPAEKNLHIIVHNQKYPKECIVQINGRGDHSHPKHCGNT